MKESWGDRNTILALAGVFFIAINLRAPITSVGPVLPEIIYALKLNNIQAGLITTIPLIAFGCLSIFAPKLSERFGLENIIGYSMIILMLGVLIRVSGSVSTLMIGAGLIGIAIAMGNVLMPSFIKKRFSDNLGLATGLMAVSMNLTGALGAGFSTLIGEKSVWGWKASIGIWAIVAFAGFMVWTFQLKPRDKNFHTQSRKTSLLKNHLAWYITILMGLQSCLFYILITWLPVVMQSWGLGKEESGWMLSYIQFAQLPITFIAPIIIGKMKDFKGLLIVTTLILLLGFIGLINYQLKYAIVCVVLIGIGTGILFSLVMMLFVIKTRTSESSGMLSGMAQSFGYLIAAITPPLFGYIYDISGSWNTSLILLIPLTLIMLLFGLLSTRSWEEQI